MKLTAAVAILLVQTIATASSTPEDGLLLERVHSRDVVKRAPQNCGIFDMYCDNAAGACNNACYHINCAPSGAATRTMVKDATNDNNRNRIQSGCQSSNSKSVCNALPFSQYFHDPLLAQAVIAGDTTLNCDEWPMADTKQNDYVQGQWRNSLRCIDQGENSSGGAQLLQFLAGNNARGRKKTCGTVQDGDYWQVNFITAGVDPNRVLHCVNPSACADPYQFHMTLKGTALSFPYTPATDNHYRPDGGAKDVLQCRVEVHRQGDNFFNVNIFDNDGVRRGNGGNLSSYSNGGFVVITGLPADLKFTRTGPFAASGAGMSFQYMSSPPFSFFGDTRGASLQYQADGKYCSVVNSGTSTNPVQDLRCYFPCPAA